MSEAKKHVIVVGAGIVGVSTAIWLQRDGHQVTLVDREGPAAGTSFGNAGLLASGSIVPVTGPGLIGKAPKMLFDPDQPLFLRWSYLPKLLPWLFKYLSHANAADSKRIASALFDIIGDSGLITRATPSPGRSGAITESSSRSWKALRCLSRKRP